MNSLPDHNSRGILKFYDLIGERYDWFGMYESHAKAAAQQALEVKPGQRILNVGVGTGKEHLGFQKLVQPGGFAFGLDLSPVMARLAANRTGALICRADARELPFSSDVFDSLYCAYVLELLPRADLITVLRGFLSVLKPGGRVVLLSMTEGVNLFSRVFVSVWKMAYKISPIACGGCLPLRLSNLVERAGFNIRYQQAIVQLGLPSELVVAEKSM